MRRPRLGQSLGTTLLVLFAISQLKSQTAFPARPIDGLSGVLDAFSSHPIVALSEGTHGNLQGHAFRTALIRDPRFRSTVNDVVVEFGNAKYQAVIDRFVAGAHVPYGELRDVWRNTTQTTTVWDHDIYEEFFRTIREVNAKVPKDRRVRALLGDPPIEWTHIHGSEDLAEWRNWMAQRDSFPADLIRREVLARNRRALLIYGAGHLQRATIDTNYEPSEIADSIVTRLERENVQIFSVWTNVATDLAVIQRSVASWPTPSLAILRGTVLGEKDYTAYVPAPRARFAVRDGKPVQIPTAEWRPMPMENEFDALLYLGRPETITYAPLAAALCRDTEYLKVRLWRLALTPGTDAEISRVTKECGPQ